MINRILVPMNDSEMAQKALEYAFEAFGDAEITVLHVVGKTTPMMGEITGLALEDDFQTAAEEQANEVFDIARKIAEEHDMEINTRVAVGHPARTIIKESEAFDTVVIGSHSGSLVDRLFVGNVAQQVFQRAPVPVMVIR
ncbi:universal stress protein [Halalkalicoccus paucihalophilus]|uniref:Universal stress protein n=1 Tax=Halalkalicoccus paucihalophilus TaxID=1008153 RepID=A0A151A808_9EURY|nr:universal stress protein [Halalkalicoccus paucihalophilus]KYH23753.1 universal stress protein [Halalkalicoccus paucihalophilus]